MPFEFGTHFPFTRLRSLGSEIVELFDSSSLIVAGAWSAWSTLHQDAYFLLNVFGWHKDWNFFWCDTIPIILYTHKQPEKLLSGPFHQLELGWGRWYIYIYISHVECDLFFSMWLYSGIYEIFFHYDQSSCDLITHLNTHIYKIVKSMQFVFSTFIFLQVIHFKFSCGLHLKWLGSYCLWCILFCRLTQKIFSSYVVVPLLTWRKPSQKGYISVWDHQFIWLHTMH